MKKYIQLTVVVISFLFIVLVKRIIWNNHPSISPINSQVNSTNSASGSSTVVQDTTPEVEPPTNEPTPSSQPSVITGPSPIKKAGKYKDGTFIGSIEDASYGEVQVEISITDGRISNVIFLKYPNSDPASLYINTEAMPELKSEAIKSQSAQLDGVTGASFTSQSFRDSLRNALVKASS